MIEDLLSQFIQILAYISSITYVAILMKAANKTKIHINLIGG